MKVTRVGELGVIEKWKWHSSPNSIRIEAKDSHHLRYAIIPPAQDILVMVSYWIEDHNELINNIQALEEGLDRVITERDEFLKELNER